MRVADGAARGFRRPQERFSTVDGHPFFSAIADRKTGAIRPTGAISDPKQ
jgi:hypothetical protein